MVRAAGDGSWAVELNPETLPRVLVDQVYFAQVSGRTKNQAEKEFLAECLQNANWLTRSLDQRAKTILKVASEIVRQQDAFLVHGVRHLRPLNLRTVADAIGMHESTVSRVTANKYMLTPRGVFELRYFFTASIAAVGRRRRAFLGSGARPHPADDRRGEAGRRAFRRRDCGYAEGKRRRHRPAHGRQVSGRHEHSLLGAAPARKARHGRGRALKSGRHCRAFGSFIDKRAMK